MFVPVNEGKIYCEITGIDTLKNGRPILFIIPGGPGLDHTMYKETSRAFEEFCHVVYYDPRGCGKSSDFEVSLCNMENHAADIEVIRNHFGLDKINILGTSYGSMVAMKYAISHGYFIEKLILVAGAPSYHFLQDAKNNLAARGSQEQIDLCNNYLWPGTFDDANLQKFFKVMRPLYSNKVARGELPPRSGRTECSIDVLNFAFSTYFKTFDLVPDLSKIQCETLILFGKNDWINDPKHAEVMHQHIYGSKLFLLDSGHSVAVDQQEKYISLIKEFFSIKN